MNAEVRVVAGCPELFVDGERKSRMLGRLALPAEEAPNKLEQYLGSGIDVFLTTLDQACNLGWDGAEGYDYSAYERHLQRILEVKPDALLVLYVGCIGASPYRWNRAHPEELALLDNGDRLRLPSLASERWRRDSRVAFQRFVRRFQDGPYADNVIGYNPVMYANEWLGPTARNAGRLDDYSRPMQRRFRDWLRERYGDAEALREAWRDPSVTFDDAEIPGPGRRRDYSVFRDPDAGRQVPDYARCYYETSAGAAIDCCRAVKEASDGSALTLLMHGNKPAARLLLESPWVDGLHGPYDYANRRGCHYSGYSVDSIRAHGKLYLDQTDTGTHLMPLTGGEQLGMGPPWTPPRVARTKKESLHVLARDMAYPLTKNLHCYWNEGGPGWMFPIFPHGAVTWGRFWFDDPDIKKLIGRLKELADENQRAGTEGVGQVALIHSQDSRMHLCPGGGLDAMFGVQGLQQTVLCRCGVPFDQYLLEDFESIPRSYRVYVFANAFYVPTELKQAIRRKLAEDGATAVWFHGSGYADEKGAGVDRVRNLTGFHLAEERGPGPVQVEIADKGHPFLRGLNAGSVFGSGRLARRGLNMTVEEEGRTDRCPAELPAVFWAEDDRAEVLGALEGTGRAALAVKEANGFRSVWIAAPQPPWQLLRNIFADSGAHIYSEDGDLVYANGRYVALSAQVAGPKTIRLPERADVTDAVTGETLARGAGSVSFACERLETRLFRLSSRT